MKGTSLFNLGGTEADILRVIWEKDKGVTVREVYETLRAERKIAYTTVMTIMGNLTKKGWLEQDKNSLAYVYHAIDSRDATFVTCVEKLARKFYGRANAEMASGPLYDVMAELKMISASA